MPRTHTHTHTLSYLVSDPAEHFGDSPRCILDSSVFRDNHKVCHAGPLKLQLRVRLGLLLLLLLLRRRGFGNVWEGGGG
jgi:hypothetical protein